MRKFPTMTYRNFILRFASETYSGRFYCTLCHGWFNKHRWIHFKLRHRYSEVTQNV